MSAVGPELPLPQAGLAPRRFPKRTGRGPHHRRSAPPSRDAAPGASTRWPPTAPPTASLDALAEHALFERYARAARAGVARGAVTVLVSHRFSTVRSADLILVFEEGGVTEMGGHDELIVRDGLYSELYGMQAHSYR